jgi:hypothetical protein
VAIYLRLYYRKGQALEIDPNHETAKPLYDKLKAPKAKGSAKKAAPAASGAKFCSECGAPLKAGAKFCVGCGAKV